MAIAVILAVDVHHSAASICGDANGDGSVTVTDGVLILRQAAALPSSAQEQTSDMNFDAQITVTDGVLVLRSAAGLPVAAACLDSQVTATLVRFGPVTKLGFVLQGARVAAAADMPCSGGGTTRVDADRLIDDHCREEDVVTNGVILLSTGEVVNATFDGFTATNVVTGEVVDSTGTVTVQLKSDGGAIANGTVTRSSSALGTFVDELDDVVVGEDGTIANGTLLTTVTQGRGTFADVRTIRLDVRATTLSVAVADFTNGQQEVGILADPSLHLCSMCGAGDPCMAPLACIACSAECTGVIQRCSIPGGAFGARCEDGLF